MAVDKEVVDQIMELHRQGLSVPEIAERVGKHRMHVGRIIKRVQRHAAAAEQAAKNPAPPEPPKEHHPPQYYIAQKKAREIEAIKSKAVVRKIDKMFTPEDADYFVEQWRRWEKQLIDMTPAEEDMLEKLLILDLRIVHNQKSIKDSQEVVSKLREQLNDRELDVENDLDLQIHQTIMSSNQHEIELNKQCALLMKEYKDIQEKLNATRQQREQNAKVGAETFLELIAKMNTEEFRERVGEQNELMKRAVKKKTEKWQMGHKYVDGMIDLPLLDGAHIKKVREAEAKAEKHDTEQLEKKIEEQNNGEQANLPSDGG